MAPGARLRRSYNNIGALGDKMSLADLASLGSFVSGLAVLASLIFLYFQMRQVHAQIVQAEKNQQAAVAQGRMGRTVEIILTNTDPEVAQASLKGFAGADDISAVALQQFSLLCRAAFYNWEETFDQHASGLLNQQAFDNLAVTIAGAAHGIGWRAQWRMQRLTFGSKFRAWMDECMARNPLVEDGPQAIDGWRQALAAERGNKPN